MIRSWRFGVDLPKTFLDRNFNVARRCEPVEWLSGQGIEDWQLLQRDACAIKMSAMAPLKRSSECEAGEQLCLENMRSYA
eukprot:SAG31_NODE_6540_length_1982_cov_164.242167_1_plen_80_part_00